MNGKVMKVVASTMPGRAKMTLKSWSLSQPPNQPRAPNTSTKIRPAITGDTANGRSMSVSSRPLPRNSYLVIAQAAAVPNTVLSGTEMAATVSVMRMAASASPSVSACR